MIVRRNPGVNLLAPVCLGLCYKRCRCRLLNYYSETEINCLFYACQIIELARYTILHYMSKSGNILMTIS